MKKIKSVMYVVLAKICVTVAGSRPVNADVPIGEMENVFDKVSVGGNLNLLYRWDENPYFGSNVPGTSKTDTAYGEILAKMRLTTQKNIGWSNFTAQFKSFYVSTITQDVFAVAKDTSQFGISRAWLKFDDINNSPFNLTIGRPGYSNRKKICSRGRRSTECSNLVQ